MNSDKPSMVSLQGTQSIRELLESRLGNETDRLVGSIARLVYYVESTAKELPQDLLDRVYDAEETATMINPDVYNENYGKD